MLSERLLTVIRHAGLNQKYFAEKIGVTAAFITDVLKGRSGLSQASLMKIRDEYDINVDWLLSGEGDMFLPARDGLPVVQPPNPLAELDKESRKLVEGLVHVLVQRKAGLSSSSHGTAKSQDYPHNELREIPELGRIAAGLPNSETQRDGKVMLFPRAVMPDKGPLYALRVYGESMRDAGIHKGDYAILKPVPEPRELKPGTVVAALIDGENTLKRLYVHNGGATLRAANPDFKDIEVESYQELIIQGQLKYLIKSWPDE